MIGAFAKLYLNGASIDSWDNPIWIPVDVTRDVTVATTKTTIDYPVRGKGRVSKPILAITRFLLNFDVIYDPTDGEFLEIWNRFMAEMPTDLWAADSERGNLALPAAGWRAEWALSMARQPQPLDDVMTVGFECTPHGAAEANGPIWYQA